MLWTVLGYSLYRLYPYFTHSYELLKIAEAHVIRVLSTSLNIDSSLKNIKKGLQIITVHCEQNTLNYKLSMKCKYREIQEKNLITWFFYCGNQWDLELSVSFSITYRFFTWTLLVSENTYRENTYRGKSRARPYHILSWLIHTRTAFWHTWLEKYQPFVTCFHSWNTNRDAYKETGEPARLAAQLAWWWGKINRNSLLGWLGSKGRTKYYCTGMTSPTIHPRKDPFHLYSLSLHSP